jgi:hypothetical protein
MQQPDLRKHRVVPFSQLQAPVSGYRLRTFWFLRLLLSGLTGGILDDY